ISGYTPVVYIDGVRYNMSSVGNFNPTGAGLSGQSTQVTSALNLISPQDIESIEVIKGPAAATLYGADAANGVIQIITKKGNRAQQRTRWNTRLESGQQAWHLDAANNYTTCDSLKQSAPALWPGCAAVARNSVLIDNPLKRDPTALRNANVLKLSASVRGGADRYSYFFGANRDVEQGVMYNSDNSRTGGRANFTFMPSSQTDIAFSLGYASNRLRLPVSDETGNGLTLSAARGKPGRDTTKLSAGWSTIYPLLANAYYNAARTDRLTIGTTGTYQPLSWFRNRVTLGVDYTDGLADIISAPGSADSPSGFSAEAITRQYLYTLDYAGNVTSSIPRWRLDLVTSGGLQVIANRRESLLGTGTGLGAGDVVLIQTAALVTGSNSFSENNSVGYYVQEQIGHANRMFLTLAERVDNNSSFGSNFRVITYPKASLSWVMSEEPRFARFFDLIHADNFKFRYAWGQAGTAPGPFQAVQTYTVDKVTLGSGTASALRTSAFGNPNLKPERGTESEIGFESGFLRNRLGVDFTYYDKTTRDMLAFVGIPGSAGFGGASILSNLGKVTNRGVELSLFGTPVQWNGVSWDTRVNVASNRNRLVDLGNGSYRQSISGQAYAVLQEHRMGYPLGGYWVPNVLRNPDGSPRTSPSGTVLTDTAVANFRFVGPSTPTREIAWSNTVTLPKGFRVYWLLDYKGGHYLFNQRLRNQCQAANDNCWITNNPRARFPQTAADTLLNKELAVYRQIPAAFISKADFTKLRDLSLSYSLPSSMSGRMGASEVTITLAGHNLALWSDYTGADPEVNSYGGRLFARADTYTVPMLRRWTLALNATF
ncbi:MAG TPA: TonB-dependent receptor, partial [Gemmatimonadaceae bacterium]|nr:TonB-dependent receptor [Gemmatimonadaceae bacterium]